MAKNDYIEKITQNLEHLTKDELKDVSILTTAQLGVRSKFAERQQLEHEIANLTSQLQQQALPVVPEYVAKAIESIPNHYSAFEALDLIKSKVEVFTEENKDWLPVYNWLCVGIENQDIFALAFIMGRYTVEKPQLFYLKNKLTNGYLCQYLSDKSFYHLDVAGDRVSKLVTKYTQEEIDSMQTGSYELVPVEDGE